MQSSLFAYRDETVVDHILSLERSIQVAFVEEISGEVRHVDRCADSDLHNRLVVAISEDTRLLVCHSHLAPFSAASTMARALVSASCE
jgi:ligand-binding sensor protein